MPELKQNFSKAKMNKDMDERLVPLGQYRDALNIQIATSDSSDIGAAQTLMGNFKYSTMRGAAGVYNIPDTSTVVGSIASPSRDKIYYFISNNSTTVKKDYIMEFDDVSQTHKYVFVDIYEVNTTTSDAEASDQAWINVDAPNTFNDTGIRIGMTVAGTIDGVTYSHTDNLRVSNIVFHDTADDNWKIYLEKNGVAFNDASGGSVSLQFRAPRVLHFDEDCFIDAINILEDVIYWTDGKWEPKKVNIPRSIAGTGGTTYLKGTTNAGYLSGVNTSITSVPFAGETDYFHTRLALPRSIESLTTPSGSVSFASDLEIQTRSDRRRATYVDESHLTVIRRAPTQPLDLEMYRSAVPRIDASGNETPLFTSHSSLSFFTSGNAIQAGGDLTNITFNSSVDFRVGDKVVLVRTNATDEGNTDFETFDARGEITASNVTNPNAISSTGFSIKLSYVRSGLEPSDNSWYIRLDAGDEFFKFKFPRFSYRYKYADGEYSTFAPFSKVAFLPDYYEFLPQKGYNLGMVNQLRSLKIKGYVPQELNLPKDVVSVDILYKETNNPTVSIVKTITKFEDHPVWPNLANDSSARGEYTLLTDMIHAVVPSNQLLRPWDNVPRTAKAQEISANRIIYGNYLQNFNVKKEPIIKVGYEIGASGSDGYGLTSVKSERTYQLGVVFSDKYGRETPVISTEHASFEVPKTAAVTNNCIAAQIQTKNIQIPSWAEYYSFYIKEPTVEYYNASMDKWYRADDGNMWLSFPSSERNKFDLETFIGLKKQHGSDVSTVSSNRRYKVLAIENEAPDDVKTKREALGVLYNGSSVDEFAIGNSVNGWPQIGATYIIVKKAAFEESFGDLTTFTEDSLDIKFYGGYQGNSESNKYEVIKLSRTGSDEDADYKVKIKGSFGTDVEWIAGPTQQYSFIVANLTMRVIRNKVMNRPEFDGRFFVKIYKDEELIDILQSNNADANYKIAASWGLRYVNNNGYVNAGTHVDSTGTNGFPGEVPLGAIEVPATGTSSFSTITGTNNIEYEDSDFGNGEFSTHPTEHNWSSLPNYSNAQSTYYWGNNTGEPNGNNEAFGVSAGKMMDGHSLKYINGRRKEAEDFWLGMSAKKHFFIDACTAWSWTAGDGDRPGNMHIDNGNSLGPIGPQDNNVWSLGPDAYGAGGNNATASSSNYGGGDDNVPGNTIAGKGQPSRGIWNNGKCMDIAWTGMGQGASTDGNITSAENYALELKAMAQEEGVYEIAWQFIKILVQPGCKFKFGSDPDGTVYTVSDFKNFYGQGPDNVWQTYGWDSQTGQNLGNPKYLSGTNKYSGVVGIRNYAGEINGDLPFGTGNWGKQWEGNNLRQRWTLVVDPPIGSQGVGYNPVHGVNPNLMNQDTGDLGGVNDPSFRRALRHDGTEMTTIQILAPTEGEDGNHFSDNPAVWETEPKESVDIDIYYQASGLIPLRLNEKTNEEYIPIGSTFTLAASEGEQGETLTTTHTVSSWTSGESLNFTPAVSTTASAVAADTVLTFTRPNGSSSTAVLKTALSLNTSHSSIVLHGGAATNNTSQILATQKHKLNWSNCWTFGNGVESDRIRDDYNAPQMDNGVKASTVLETSIKEERRSHGLIWSGIYNSTSGVNETNQFIAAEKITKDLNPVYGSIQKLYNRNTRLIIFCEDKILRAVTNRDALYNADGSPQLVASNAVVGDVQAYQGNYGISTNPESCVATPYQIYFTDAMRGQVLALSGEGVRSISDIGMRNYFSRQFDYADFVLGTYDMKKNEYNLSVYKKYNTGQLSYHDKITASYSEAAKGWTSFRSFYPETGLSLNNNYYTFYNGHIWKHHTNKTYNNFYGDQYTSTIKLLFNEKPEAVKSFQTINYEGSQARVVNFDTESTSSWLTGDYSSGDGLTTNSSVTDGEYYNLGGAGADSAGTDGWYTNSIITNLQSGDVFDFREKENKWFGQVRGDTTALSNLDLNEFSVQGLGTASIAHSSPSLEETITFPIKNNTGSTWDSTPD